MPKVTISNKLTKKEMNRMLNLLYAKISKLKNKRETADFISDVLTESEQIMVLRRLQIAKLLIENNTYREIKNKLGAGIDNIKNVHKKIDFGSGGYLNFIKKL